VLTNRLYDLHLSFTYQRFRVSLSANFGLNPLKLLCMHAVTHVGPDCLWGSAGILELLGSSLDIVIHLIQISPFGPGHATQATLGVIPVITELGNALFVPP
jgi:hypothetical protein